ncbi:2-C-methyl-D-erythritol 4-phosphate cytidylyltransferase [Prolixibacter sp. SD074]|uniref:2-C-methyl-D-erythritol 4-phosphate cytidylyltransferase n=1 Tax=Prolixibacter sp. SD074 TaxID=2652391 RepID=UPI001274B416|nr:2-C-methyl-D-erythritol 4-phosphate cytidylyltransferase [Prolixibacter sp. SD074]GET30367.1 2-C-methyl-D-erythritol 4-phosphate cytidylyltransferase [Prolixibacter sp. SD074]
MNKPDPHSTKRSVIVVAGGSGSRMKSDRPKQFLELLGKPVLMYTLEAFNRFDSTMDLIVVLPADQIPFWEQLCLNHNFVIRHQVVAGGDTRFHSVKNGLSALSACDLVAIHDGVRPLVSQTTIENCFLIAKKQGTAIPVLPVIESLREGNMEESAPVDRSRYYSVQTPQIFRTSTLLKAYEQDFNSLFTDDASVVESAGFRVKLVEGNRENIKITHPVDLRIAEFFLSLPGRK